MRHPLLAAILLLAVGTPGSADDIDVTSHGAKPDGASDCAPAFQAAIDAAAATGQTVHVPPGRYRFWSPVYLDRDGVSLRGAGVYATTILASGWSPAIVAGVRRVETGGRTIDATIRPDAAGILDATAAPWPGVRRGFATKGRVYLIATGHPVQVGRRSLAVPDRVYDAYSEMPGLTLDLCLAPDPAKPWAAWQPLMGLGNPGYEAGPWNLLVAGDAQTLAFTFRTADIPEGPSMGEHWIMIPLAGQAPPYRVRVWVDLVAGTAGASVNGSVVATGVNEQYATGHKFAPGSKFRASRLRYPFFIGTAGEFSDPNGSAVTPCSVWGLRLSAAAHPTDQADDLHRYFTPDADTFALLPLTDGPARSIRLDTGPAADQDTGRAFLIHADGFGGQIHGAGVSDLAIQDGSHAILLGSAKGATFERIRGLGSMVGLGSLPLFYSAPVTVRDCEFTGYDAGVSIWRCYLRAEGMDIMRGGRTSIRLAGCNASVRSTNVYFFSPLAETAIDILLSEYGGKYQFDDVLLDTEGTAGFAEAAIRCELHPAAQTRLSVRGLDVPFAGGGDLFGLVGHAQGGEWTPGVFEAGMIAAGPHAASVRANGPGWSGTLDARLFPSAARAAGDSAATIRLGTGPTP